MFDLVTTAKGSGTKRLPFGATWVLNLLNILSPLEQRNIDALLGSRKQSRRWGPHMRMGPAAGPVDISWWSSAIRTLETNWGKRSDLLCSITLTCPRYSPQAPRILVLAHLPSSLTSQSSLSFLSLAFCPMQPLSRYKKHPVQCQSFWSLQTN